MILFKGDWVVDGVTKAIVHRDTNNKTFLRMAAVYSKMGIENNLFHLALTQPDLAKYDPHNLTDNSNELKLRIAHECQINPWYYFREVIRIPVPGGDGTPFEAHRGNLSMIWAFYVGIDYLSTQPRQTGKAQPLSSKIKTPDGWTYMRDIRVGDMVTAPDGTATKVTGVFPQGKKVIYRVTFEDGRSAECCDEHLWKVYNRYWSPEDTRWRIVPLSEIRKRLKERPNTEAGLFIPLVKENDKADIELPLDPYLVGALLGDGGLMNGTVNFTSADQFIIDEITHLLPENVEIVYASKYDYRICDRSTIPGQRSKFLSTLRDMGMLGKYSYEKRIPTKYLEASATQRLALLQGLMDTDGTVDKSGSSSFCTTSQELANEVQYLVRSLGGICKMRTKVPTYTHNGEKRTGRLAYILRIRIDNPKSLFRLPRKKARISDNYKSAGKLFLGIKSVTRVRETNAQCIQVSHPDHLYITDDFTVTHNTVSAISISSHVVYFGGRHISIGMLTKDTNLRQENVSRLKDIRDNLPKWLIHNQTKDVDNKEGIEYAALDNRYITFVGQQDKQAASNVGRGQTIPVIHTDETGFIANIDITHPVIMAAASEASKRAKALGMPHSNIYTTTAARIDTGSGKFAFGMMNDAMPFTEKLFDVATKDAALQMVNSNSVNGKINGTWSYLQLGRTHAWFVETIAKLQATDEEIDRDFLNMWKAGTDRSILSEDLVKKMAASAMEPMYTEITDDGYAINWYIPEHVVKSSEFKSRQMVLGVDSSENIGRDFTSAVLVDPKDMSTVATFRCNESNVIKVAILFGNFLVTHPKTVFIPERKSTGSAIIDQIIMILINHGFNPFFRIFNQIVQNRDKEPFSRIDMRQRGISDSVHRKYLGFQTTGRTRPFLYKNTLNKAAQNNHERMRDRTIISELSALSVVNGRVDHKEGNHDDSAIAYLLACWLVYEGQNLKYYGLDISQFLQDIPGTGDGADPHHRRHQLELRNRIRHLEAAAKASTSEMLKQHFRYKIVALEKQLDDTIVEAPIVSDQVRETIRERSDAYSKPENAPSAPKQITHQDVFRSMNAIMGK